MVRRKVIYVAAAPPGEAAADLRRLGLLEQRDSLRVVVPGRLAPELKSRAMLSQGVLLRYAAIAAPWVWLRLMIFLGLSSENGIIVFSPAGRSRLLKLVSLALRGRVSFSDGNGSCVPFSLGSVLQAGWRLRFAARGPICLIGSASPGSVRAIFADVRRRYPDAPVHGVLPAALAGSADGLDSVEVAEHSGLGAYVRIVRRCVGRGRFRRIILPWTNEKSAALRWMGWLLPLWRVEVYNEHLDAFPGRNLGRLLGHWLWRSRLRKKQHRRTLPVGVIGSASSFYLEKILSVLRAEHPGVEIHGLLPEALAAPAAGLFDSTEILRGGFFAQWLEARRFVRRRKEYQCWVVACTNEPYAAMKFLAFLLPLARRRIYNELGDGFVAREGRTLYRHYLWRVRDHLSYQIVAGAAGGSWITRLGQLVLYSGRLLAGAAVLRKARFRSRRIPEVSRTAPRVDLLLWGAPHDGRDSSDAMHSVAASLPEGSVRVVRVPRNGSFGDVNDAIRESDAEFVCLLDAECRVSPPDWLGRLLASFDDRTAQVGPELASLDGEMLLRGMLLESRGALAWNFDNAVRWHRSPECLEVDALPRLCVLFRRRIFSEAGYFAEDSCTMELWADAAFSQRLVALGWRSVCNRSVTATHPAVRLGPLAASQEVTEEIRR